MLAGARQLLITGLWAGLALIFGLALGGSLAMVWALVIAPEDGPATSAGMPTVPPPLEPIRGAAAGISPARAVLRVEPSRRGWVGEQLLWLRNPGTAPLRFRLGDVSREGVAARLVPAQPGVAAGGSAPVRVIVSFGCGSPDGPLELRLVGSVEGDRRTRLHFVLPLQLRVQAAAGSATGTRLDCIRASRRA